MTLDSWINRKVSRLLPRSFKENTTPAHAESAQDAPKKVANDGAVLAAKRAGSRSTRERLQANLRQGHEALSPRVLRRILQKLQAVIDERVSEVEGGRRTAALMAWYAGATPARRLDLWLLMSEMFVADPVKAPAAQAEFAAALGTPDEAAAEVHYRRATVSPRPRLLQRFSADAAGIRFLVNLRAEMQSAAKTDKRLQALDVEMEYMFSTWFDVGFLELRRISWDSPASLVETLKAEFSQLKTFATLSPIPGFRSWLQKNVLASGHIPVASAVSNLF